MQSSPSHDLKASNLGNWLNWQFDKWRKSIEINRINRIKWRNWANTKVLQLGQVLRVAASGNLPSCTTEMRPLHLTTSYAFDTVRKAGSLGVHLPVLNRTGICLEILGTGFSTSLGKSLDLSESVTQWGLHKNICSRTSLPFNSHSVLVLGLRDQYILRLL